MPKEPPTGPSKWRSNKITLSWGAAGADTLKSTITAVTDAGNAILFSRTQDGSALVIKVYSGSEFCREFATTPGDILPLLAWVVETYS